MNGQKHYLYTSENIRIIWAVLVARMEEDVNVYKIMVETPEGENNLADEGADGNEMLKFV